MGKGRCKFAADEKDYDCEKWPDKKCFPGTPDHCFGYRDEEVEYCPPDCDCLNITEKEQDQMKRNPDHICKRHNKRVVHGRHHPELIKLPECDL